jgi:hypothetical protein
MKMANGGFDYTELFALCFVRGNGCERDWKEAIGISRKMLMDRLCGVQEFTLRDIENLIEFLGIHPKIASRIFCTPKSPNPRVYSTVFLLDDSPRL